MDILRIRNITSGLLHTYIDHEIRKEPTWELKPRQSRHGRAISVVWNAVKIQMKSITPLMPVAEMEDRQKSKPALAFTYLMEQQMDTFVVLAR